MVAAALSLRQALQEADEVRSWTCQSCDTMIEDEGSHCRACAAYWADVDAGVFDGLDGLELTGLDEIL